MQQFSAEAFLGQDFWQEAGLLFYVRADFHSVAWRERVLMFKLEVLFKTHSAESVNYASKTNVITPLKKTSNRLQNSREQNEENIIYWKVNNT